METKVTFKPLKHGKFRCYVDGKITDIITRNCEAVRSRFYNKDRQKNKTKVVLSDSIPSVMTNWDNQWSCPHCSRINENGFVGETQSCWKCGMSVKIFGKKSRPQPTRNSYSFF